jgi:hemolysin III
VSQVSPPATPSTDERPSLRGMLHQGGALAALCAGVFLIAGAPSSRAAWACVAFTASHVTQLTVSALYHRVTWSSAARARMRRADHAAIFVLIAGSATPFALLSMPADLGEKLMWLFWMGALVGVAVTLGWPKKPKWIMPVLCVGLGWAGAPWWLDERGTLDTLTLTLIACSGVVYSVGALCYATKRPNLVPGVFGYHELFHALTIVAAAMNFVAVAHVLGRLSLTVG